METDNFTAMDNSVLRVVYFVEPPFVNNIDRYSDTRVGHHNGPGIVMDILKTVSEKHNIRYNFTETADGIFGQRLPSGGWNGMIGMLHRNEADIIAGNIIMTEERKDVVDFTTPFMTAASGMLIRSPDQFIDNRFLIVTAPLEFQVWILIAVAILISGLAFKGICVGLKLLNQEVHFSLFECVWTFYSIFVQQDLSRLPTCTATRTMLSFWWLASLSISGFFTGNMVALFAVTRSTLPFNTRDDMVEQVKDGRYKVVFQNTSDVRMHFIKNSGLQVFQDLWFAMNHGKWRNVSTLEEGVQRVVNQPNLVLIAAKESLEALASQVCSVTTLDGDLIPVWYSIATRKNSPYTALFDEVIKKLAENGFVEKWLRDAKIMQAYQRGTQCNTSLGGGIGARGNIEIAGDAITIDKAQGVFWLLVAGTCFAVIGFVVERVWKVLRPRIRPLNAVSENKKLDESAVPVITVKPMEISPYPLHDLVESIKSYRPNPPKGKEGENEGEDKQKQSAARNELACTNQLEYNSFQPNSYGENYVSVNGVIDYDQSMEDMFTTSSLTHRRVNAFK